MAKYVDSHIHLSDAQYADDLTYAIPQFEHLDIVACAVSMDYVDSIRTLEISKMSGRILPFVGVHPERVRIDDIDDVLFNLTSLAECNAKQIVGIGEIGLDPTYDNRGEIPHCQIRAFECMLELAAKLKKPVSIHSRKSLDKIFDVMTSFDARHASLHWFDGNKRQLVHAQEMGFYISYGPVSVYASDKQKLIALSDTSKLLVETDGPVRFSRCFEHKHGQSCFVASVLYTVADVCGMSFDSAAEIVAKNSENYLGLSIEKLNIISVGS